MRSTLAVLAALASSSCSQAGLTDHDFIVELYDKGQWRPTARQAADAKAALMIHLATAHELYPYWGPLSDDVRHKIRTEIGAYYLQYYGGFYDIGRHEPVESGDKTILINGLCQKIEEPGGTNMTDRLMTANDGGWCFFQAEYSLAQNRIVQLRVNGGT